MWRDNVAQNIRTENEMPIVTTDYLPARVVNIKPNFIITDPWIDRECKNMHIIGAKIRNMGFWYLKVEMRFF